MAEYITKQQAIDLVKSLEVVLGCLGVSVLVREIERLPFQVVVSEPDFETIPINLLPDIVARLTEPCWISTKDRMPEEGEWVIINTIDREVFEAFFESGYWENDNSFWAKPNDVTHWMPLPEPPKEE